MPVPLQALKRKTKKAKKPAGPPASKNKSQDSSEGGSYRDHSPEDYSESDDEGTEGYKKGGYHPVHVGEKYKNGRYHVLRKLGWGHFSTVWLVLDNETGNYGAMKVQKSAQHYTEAARDEITLLTQIKGGDPSDEKHCCRLLDWFEHSGPHGRHICMVFEVLGDNLLALIKKYDYKGIPIPIVRNLARQMLVALDYLHRQLQIIHTDFKPENVMLVEPLHHRSWDLPSLAEVKREPAPASVLAAGQVLTKNQKKKAKRKQKRAELKAPPDGEAVAGVSGAGDDDEDEEPSMSTEGNAENGGSNVQQADETSGQTTSQVSSQSDDLKHQPEVSTVSVPGLTEEQLHTAICKVVDFGNACWTHKQFTTDIQTRQYRCPEVLLGAKYSTSADMWSLACVIFELVTGDLLFDPRSGDNYDRDEDHLALFIELLGKLPRRVYEKGKYAKDYFNRNGELRHIKKLKFWPLDRVLVEKYRLSETEAAGLTDFLLPMLEFIPENRAKAGDMLSHPWLRGELPSVEKSDPNKEEVVCRREDKSCSRRPSRSGSRSRSPGHRKSRSASPSPPLEGHKNTETKTKHTGNRERVSTVAKRQPDKKHEECTSCSMASTTANTPVQSDASDCTHVQVDACQHNSTPRESATSAAPADAAQTMQT